VKYTVIDWLRFAGLGFSVSETSGMGLIGRNSFWIFCLPFLAYMVWDVECIHCLLMHMFDTDTTWDTIRIPHSKQRIPLFLIHPLLALCHPAPYFLTTYPPYPSDQLDMSA
jgi:hypothetical protein